MKKMLVLMLVLAVATMASAATVAFQAPAKVDVGQIVTITVVSTGDVTSITLPEIWSNKGGVASDLVLNPILDQFPQNGNANNEGNKLITGVSGAAPFSFPPAAVAAGEAIYSFNYTVPELQRGEIIEISGAGVMYFQFSDFSSVAEVASASMEVIPEPMTIALLGLGGLFIRRRK